MTRRTFCPANLRFFAGHFRLSSDIFKLRMTGKHRFIFSSLDILSGDLGALRRTFLKFARHVRRVRRISGSLQIYICFWIEGWIVGMHHYSQEVLIANEHPAHVTHRGNGGNKQTGLIAQLVFCPDEGVT